MSRKDTTITAAQAHQAKASNTHSLFELRRRAFRAFAYGSRCMEVAEHLSITPEQAKSLLDDYKAIIVAARVKVCVKCKGPIRDPQLEGDEICARCAL